MIDWDNIPDNTAFDEKRRKQQGQGTFREYMEKAYAKADQEATVNPAEQLKALENKLLKALINRQPIKVLAPIENYTDSIGGREEEDDGFYKSAPRSPENNKFETVIERIPAGITLTFVHLEKSLGNLIFQGSNGKDYEIPAGHKLFLGQGNIVNNPGYLGLLYYTDINQ